MRWLEEANSLRQSRMVVARGCGEQGVGSYCLVGIVSVQEGEKVLET